MQNIEMGIVMEESASSLTKGCCGRCVETIWGTHDC